MEIKDEKLIGEGIKFIASPNHGAPFKPGNLDTIIIHYTAGRSAESSVKSLCDAKAVSPASAHLVVGRDNSITQLLPFNIIGWHAGKSQFEGRIGFNSYSIGIEIDNAGEMTKSGEDYLSWFGKKYPKEEVAELIHRNQTTPKFWHLYTEDQISITLEICAAIARAYPIKHILGHEEIAPIRKTDPGPAFPLDKLRERIFSMRSEDDAEEVPAKEGKVKANQLNIRQDPAKTAETIAKPLKSGTPVKILEEKEGWYKVTTEITGWVAKDFIEV